MELSVIICTYNRSKFLNSSIGSLLNQNADRKHYEILVVDNNSDDDTAAVVRSFTNEGVQYVFEKKQGLSNARNRGWQEAKGEYIAYIDDDAKADADWISRLLDIINSVHPRPIAIGGPVYAWYEIDPPFWFLEKYVTQDIGRKTGFVEGRVGFQGPNMVFHKELFNNYGGFRTDLGMIGNKMGMGEETEICSRFYKKNPYFYFDSALKVYHWVPKEKMKLWYQLRRSYSSGVGALRFHESRKVCSFKYIRQWMHFFYEAFLLPYKIIKSKRTISQESVHQLKALFVRLGYLTGKK